MYIDVKIVNSSVCVPVAVPVKHPESLPDVFAVLVLLHLLLHHGEELREVDAAVTVHVNLHP